MSKKFHLKVMKKVIILGLLLEVTGFSVQAQVANSGSGTTSAKKPATMSKTNKAASRPTAGSVRNLTNDGTNAQASSATNDGASGLSGSPEAIPMASSTQGTGKSSSGGKLKSSRKKSNTP